MSVSPSNAHLILDVKSGSSPDELRKAYLNLVRQHPPDRDPEKFRDIHAAYQLLLDPLAQADALLSILDERVDLATVISDAAKVHPRLSTLNLLALGNRE